MTPDRRAYAVSIFVVRPASRAVLLILHKRLQRWVPPGGEVEPGETPSEAAARELLEETGLVPRWLPSPIPFAPAGLIGYEEHEAGSKGLHLCFAFGGTVGESPSPEVPPAVASHAKWVALEELEHFPAPDNVRGYARMAIGLCEATMAVGL